MPVSVCLLVRTGAGAWRQPRACCSIAFTICDLRECVCVCVSAGSWEQMQEW